VAGGRWLVAGGYLLVPAGRGFPFKWSCRVRGDQSQHHDSWNALPVVDHGFQDVFRERLERALHPIVLTESDFRDPMGLRSSLLIRRRPDVLERRYNVVINDVGRIKRHESIDVLCPNGLGLTI
jgi:hypothetical protein